MSKFLAPTLLLAALALSLACTGAEKPTATPVSPTVPPSSAPTVTLPSPTPPQTQVPLPHDAVAARDYAVACRQLLDVDIGYGAEGKRGFAEWVDSARALTPPPELRDFHESWVTQFEGQLEISDGSRTSIEPNAMTQQAKWRKMEIVSAMRPELRQILVDEWCLLETEVMLYPRILAAKARLEANPVRQTTTVDEFLQVCADIKVSTPTMDSMDALYTHLITEWQNLIPPPGLEGYHAAVLDFYLEMEVVQDPGRVPIKYLLAAQEAAKKAALKYPDFIELLIRSGCGG